MSRTPQEQLVHFLSDMYSVEQQALAQLVSAPEIAGDPSLAEDFRIHYAETQQQAERVRECLEAHGGSPSAIKDAIMKVGGKGFLLFAQSLPETPGRLAVHAYAYEAMEWAGYEMLARFASRANDPQTVEMANAIAAEERTMMGRLEQRFDEAERVSHADLSPEELTEHVRRHLTDVHAFESQAETLYEKSRKIGGDPRLDAFYANLRDMSCRHAELVENRLVQLGSDASGWKDAALAAGGWNWGLFFQAQSDTPAKLAAFAYAFVHLQIGGYELLKRTASRAGDAAVEAICAEAIAEKKAAASKLVDGFDVAAEGTLAEVHA